jgi:N-acyl homoserine lactone hydrolase
MSAGPTGGIGRAAEPLPAYPDWTQRLLDLDPRQVLFAHDNSIWHPAAS